MIVEIDYEPVTEEEWIEIKKNTTRIMAELFIDWLKENSPKE